MSYQPHSIPKDGFAGTGGPNGFNEAINTTHNNSKEMIPVGTKVSYYNDTLGAKGTCVYMRFDNGAGNIAIIAGSLVRSTTTIGRVSGEVSSQVVGGSTAIALSAMTDLNYGWFWCGGVCPDFNTASGVKFSASNILTDGGVFAGNALQSGTANLQVVIATGAQVVPHLGYSLIADTGTALAMASVVLYDRFA